MKPSAKFVSSSFWLALAIVSFVSFLTICEVEITGCFLYPHDFPIYLIFACIFFGLLVASSWIFAKKIYIVEVYDGYFRFKSLLRRYTVKVSQMKAVEIRNVSRDGKTFILEVEGYRYSDTYKFFYPFQFRFTKKTQQAVKNLLD